jgi:hypothetical protein
MSPGLMSEGSAKAAKTGKSGKSKKRDKVPHAEVVPVTEAPPGPSSRIAIALPFSQISMEEPSQELADVVALIGELVLSLEGTLTSTQYEAFAAQVESLQARLH